MRFGSVHGTSYTRNDQTMDCWIISLTFLKKTKQPFVESGLSEHFSVFHVTLFQSLDNITPV